MEQWEWRTLNNSTGIVESFLIGLMIWLLFFVLNIFLKILIPPMGLIGFFQFLLIQIICASYLVFYGPYMTRRYRKKLLLKIKSGDTVELFKNNQIIKAEVLEIKFTKKYPQRIKFQLRNLLTNKTSWVDSEKVYVSTSFPNEK